MMAELPAACPHGAKLWTGADGHAVELRMSPPTQGVARPEGYAGFLYSRLGAARHSLKCQHLIALFIVPIR